MLPRHPFGHVFLTEDDPRAPNPPGFEGHLWRPQATLLQAMLDLEESGGVALPREQRCLAAEGGRIAAEFSFGKTVLCIALVCASPQPRPRPQPLNFMLMARPAEPPKKPHREAGAAPLAPNCLVVAAHHPLTGRGYDYQPLGRGAFPELALHYAHTYPATLVIAAPSVITQWEAAVRRFAPGLRAFTIEGVSSLRSFEKTFRAAPPYDLVFLKAGKVSTSFQSAGEPPPPGRQRPLTAALTAALRGWAWARLIVDDFDTLRLAMDDVYPPARFTWVISATQRSSSMRQGLVPASGPAGFLRHNARLALLGGALDGVLNAALRLQCSPAYVEAHIRTTVAHFRRVVLPGGKAVGILQDLGVPPEVLEMAAAGALGTASEQLGIRVESMKALVEKVLEARVGKYRRAVLVGERVAEARAAGRAPGGGSPGPPALSAADLRLALKQGDEDVARAAIAAVDTGSKPVAQVLQSLEDWAEAEKAEHGGRLRRMREHLRDGCCPACAVPIEDDAYVLSCCQVVICGPCAFLERQGGGCRFIARCPHCAASVDPRTSLLYIGSDLDLAGGFPDDAALFSGPAAAPPEPPPAPLDEKEVRLRTLIDLLREEPPAAALEDLKGLPPFVSGLLAGHRDVPRPPQVSPKFLVFAMHAESSDQITRALAAEGIAAARLAGKRGQKDAAVAQFRAAEGPAVLVATSSQDSAGLHLPEVSTVIFFNRHLDVEIAKQAIGRAQRVGREFSLEVVELVTRGELLALSGG